MSALPAVTHHTARMNGITQHWVTAGDGPPVYLLHGPYRTRYAWREQSPELAAVHGHSARPARLRRDGKAGI